MEGNFIEQHETRYVEDKQLEKNLQGIGEHIKKREAGKADGGNEIMEQTIVRLENLEKRDATNEGGNRSNGGVDKNKAQDRGAQAQHVGRMAT